MALAGRMTLGLAVACFIYIYFNAWRHIFLQPLWLYSAPSPSSASPSSVASPSLPADEDASSSPLLLSELDSEPSSISLLSILLLAALHFPLAMFWWTYYLTSTVGPGYVPKDWSADLEDAHAGRQVLWCSKCSAFRPERAHHCKFCQRCVLMMDHHCPWIQTCVGYHNTKYFLLFLFYGLISCSSFLYLFYQHYHQLPSPDESMPEDFAAAAETANWRVFASTCILGVFVFFQAFLLNDHVRLIARNKTFIDYLAVHSNPFLAKMAMSWGTSARRPKKSEEDYNRYDLGTMANIRYFLGDSMWMWFWPTPPRGTGFSYPSNRRERSDDSYDVPGESYDLRRR